MTDLQTIEVSLYNDLYSSRNSMSDSSTYRSSKVVSTTATTSSVRSPAHSDDIQELKKSLTLDFGSPKGEKIKTVNLQTPDVIKFLALTSPELEKFLTQGVTLVNTPTPTSFFFPKDVTSEQEQYARGFIDALNQLQQKNTNGNTVVSMPTLLSPNFVTNALLDHAHTDKRDETLIGSSKISGPSIKPTSVSTALSPRRIAFLNTSNGPYLAELSADNTTAALVPSLTGIGASGNVIVRPSPVNPSTNNSVSTTTLTNMQPLVVQGYHSQQPIFQQQPSMLLPMGTASGVSSQSPFVMAPSSSLSQVAAGTSGGQHNFIIPAMVVKRELQEGEANQPATTFLASPLGGPASYAALFASYPTVGGPYVALSGATAAVMPSAEASFSPVSLAVNGISPKRPRTVGPQEDLQTVPNVYMAPSQVASAIPSASQSAAEALYAPSTSRSLDVTAPTHDVIDLDRQELIKLERKRARNRAAATRCRKRKLDRIGQLEEEVHTITEQCDGMRQHAQELRDELAKLKQVLAEHRANGCQLAVPTPAGRVISLDSNSAVQHHVIPPPVALEVTVSS